MAWAFLILGGLFETAFAVSLKYSEGFTRLWPTVSFLICAVVSVVLLTVALRDMPVGTAYAVWTGIGAIGSVLAGILLFGEPAGAARLALIGLVLAGIVGLKLVEG